MMEESSEHEIKPLEIVAILSRRKFLILACLAVVLLPILVFNQITPRTYEAQTTIIFQAQSELVPTINISQPITQESYLTNQIAEIKSRTLCEEVADRLPEEIKAQFGIPKQAGTPEDRREALAGAIQTLISAQATRNSDVIEIRVQANTPRTAMVVANAVTEVLKRRNVEIKRERASSERQFIEDQLPGIADSLRQDEEALRNFRVRNQVVSLSDEAKELLSRATVVGNEYAMARSERQAGEQRLVAIRNQIASQRAIVVPLITTTTSAWADTLRKVLVADQVEYANLLVKGYARDHPQMVRLTSEIEATKQKLAAEVMRVAHGESVENPMSQLADLSRQALAMEISVQADSTKEASLKSILVGYDREMERLPDKEFQFARLIRSQQVNDNIYRLLLQRLQEARITEAGQIGNVRVIDPAVEPKIPIKPRKFQNLILGLILGLFLGGGLAFFAESLDKSLKTPEEAERWTGLPVMGLIPSIAGLDGKISKNHDEIEVISSRIFTHFVPRSPIAEAYRTLRTNLAFARPDNPSRTILVTSVVPQEGKTTVVANLAITLAQAGAKTLIVDADLRRPAQDKIFGLDNKEGLTDLLIGKGNLESLIRPTAVPNLFLLSAGHIPPNPSEILGSRRMSEFMFEFSRRFEAVYFDSPPVITVTDPAILSRNVDGVVLVVHAGSTDRDAVIRAKALLQNVQANLLGLILNNVRFEGFSYHPYFYQYYYHEDSKKKRPRRNQRI